MDPPSIIAVVAGNVWTASPSVIVLCGSSNGSDSGSFAGQRSRSNGPRNYSMHVVPDDSSPVMRFTDSLCMPSVICTSSRLSLPASLPVRASTIAKKGLTTYITRTCFFVRVRTSQADRAVR